MSYEVTIKYYNDIFYGESVDDADFPSLCSRACEIIEEMCMYKLNENAFHRMSENVKECVKKAICAQIEYLDANGGSDVDNGADIQSAALGKFNYTKAAGVSGSAAQSIYAPRAVRLMAPTGLLYRGGGCY